MHEPPIPSILREIISTCRLHRLSHASHHETASIFSFCITTSIFIRYLTANTKSFSISILIHLKPRKEVRIDNRNYTLWPTAAKYHGPPFLQHALRQLQTRNCSDTAHDLTPGLLGLHRSLLYLRNWRLYYTRDFSGSIFCGSNFHIFFNMPLYADPFSTTHQWLLSPSDRSADKFVVIL